MVTEVRTRAARPSARAPRALTRGSPALSPTVRQRGTFRGRTRGELDLGQRPEEESAPGPVPNTFTAPAEGFMAR